MMPVDTDEFQDHFRTIALERLMFYMQAHLSLIDTSALKMMVDFTARDMVMKVRYEVLGRTIEDHHLQYPIDWKQAFKERWAPEWWKRRRPVKYAVHEFRAVEILPEMAIPKNVGAILQIPYMHRDYVTDFREHKL